jgi:hypothetical protein
MLTDKLNAIFVIKKLALFNFKPLKKPSKYIFIINHNIKKLSIKFEIPSIDTNKSPPIY